MLSLGIHAVTTEFSFALKPAEHGVGVFAAHDIKAESFLRLFGDQTETAYIAVSRNETDVPDFFRQFCLGRGNILRCPQDFGRMEIGWHLNHSRTPNAKHRGYRYYALRDIKQGEEITIDYDTLGEPEEEKEDYYK